MTKAKIEKEAETYTKNVLKDCNCNLGNPKVRQINSIDIQDAYLAGAEPREKRIAELEKENAEAKERIKTLEYRCENIKDTDTMELVALQRENAELKALRESVKDYGAGCYENGLRNGKRKLEEELTKAKEIIKKLIEAIHIWDCKNLEEVEAEAEQFLKGEEE